MDPLAGVVLAFSPPSSRPAVSDDGLDEVVSAVPSEDGIVVRGLAGSDGKKWVRVEHEGLRYGSELRMVAPPRAMTLGGAWGFELKPTLNNQWGDFRWPASDDVIGAEAREFHYAEESDQSGTALGWHEAGYDAGHWPLVIRSYGPYWYASGPHVDGHETAELITQALAGVIDASRWERFSFSKQFGYERIGDPAVWGGRQGVLDEFIYFPATGAGEDAVRLMFTYVRAPAGGDWDLYLGAKSGQVRHVWLNGQAVCPEGTDGFGELSQVRVTLQQGLNTILAELVQSEGQEIRAFAAFASPGQSLPSQGPPAVPRLRWFSEPNELVYDIAPHEVGRVGWYRFEAPAGTKSMRLDLDAEAAQAWVDGEPAAVEGGVVHLGESSRKVARVALRIVQKRGVYGGAAIPEPIRFECAPTHLPLGDWCGYALEGYSGAATYSKEFSLEPQHLEGRVVLDLGMANTVAEVAVNGRKVGVGLARPYRFDLTDYVSEGDNHLEVTVYNTLANFYDVGELKSAFVFEGQTLSGLIGPVTIAFPAEVTLLARPVAVA